MGSTSAILSGWRLRRGDRSAGAIGVGGAARPRRGEASRRTRSHAADPGGHVETRPAPGDAHERRVEDLPAEAGSHTSGPAGAGPHERTSQRIDLQSGSARLKPEATATGPAKAWLKPNAFRKLVTTSLDELKVHRSLMDCVCSSRGHAWMRLAHGPGTAAGAPRWRDIPAHARVAAFHDLRGVADRSARRAPKSRYSHIGLTQQLQDFREAHAQDGQLAAGGAQALGGEQRADQDQGGNFLGRRLDRCDSAGRSVFRTWRFSSRKYSSCSQRWA